MRTWLIIITLAALVSSIASHQEHRASRKADHLKKLHGKTGGAERKTSISLPGAALSGVRTNIGKGSPRQKAAMARFVVDSVPALALGTTTTLKCFRRFVGNNIEFVTDAVNGNSTGVPYIYISKDDFSLRDLQKDNRASMSFTRVIADQYCQKLPLNAKDRDCANAHLFGKMVAVTDRAEYDTVLKALVEKVPGLKDVKKEDYHLKKLDIEAVLVASPDGSFEPVDLELYRAVKPNEYALAQRGRKSH